MFKNLGVLWWILPGLLYAILLIVVMRRGLWATLGQRIYWIGTCILVLLIPTKPAPSSYVLAVLVVFNLWVYRWSLRRGTFVLDRPSKTAESAPSDQKHETSEPDEM